MNLSSDYIKFGKMSPGASEGGNEKILHVDGGYATSNSDMIVAN